MTISKAAVIARPVLADAVIAPGLLRDLALAGLGVMLLVAASGIRIPFWPVPVTMQTFAVLVLGAAYGPRLAGMTLLAYLGLGAAGVTVFAGGSSGLAYMAGPTGGYLAGFLAASIAMGWLARRGWDRSVTRMAAALLAGNVIVYVFGLPWMAWLFAADRGMAWVIQYGMLNFLLGDALKLALAALLLPAVWKLRSR